MMSFMTMKMNSEYAETWIFQHLTPEAKEEILQKWFDNVVDNHLSECDDE